MGLHDDRARWACTTAVRGAHLRLDRDLVVVADGVLSEKVKLHHIVIQQVHMLHTQVAAANLQG